MSAVLCDRCQSWSHTTAEHAVAYPAERMSATFDRMQELLAEQAQVLAPKRHRDSQQVASTGAIAHVVFSTAPGGVNLIILIERVSHSTTSAQANPQFGLFVMDALPLNADAAQLDDNYLAELGTANIKRQVINEQAAPILVKGGEVVIGQWTGIANGDVCKARIQYRRAWQAQD